MKYFALLFSFYLFALAVMPCSDKDDCEKWSAQQTTLAKTDHSAHDNDTEHCTPFCICACCGQSYNCTFLPLSLTLHIAIKNKDFPIYNNGLLSDVYLSIWQPPKIS